MKTNTTNTRAITEGAILAAIGVVLALIGNYIPFLTIVVGLWAAPVVVCGFRNGLKTSIISTIVAAILVSMLTSPMVGISLLLGFGVPGIVMGFLLRKTGSAAFSIAIASLFFVVGLILSFTLQFYMMGFTLEAGVADIIKTYNATMEAAKPMLIQTYTKIGMSMEQIDLMLAQSAMMIDTLRLLLPTILIGSGLVYSFINFKVAYIIMKRIGVIIPSIPPFRAWRLPNNFSIGLVIMLLLVFGASLIDLPGSPAALSNLFILVFYAYAVIGFATTCFFLKVYKVNKFLQVLICTLIFLYFSTLFIILGLGEMLFNFRFKYMVGLGGGNNEKKR